MTEDAKEIGNVDDSSKIGCPNRIIQVTIKMYLGPKTYVSPPSMSSSFAAVVAIKC